MKSITRVIDWEPSHKVYEYYENKSLIDLMELYDASLDSESTIINRYDYENVPLEIASRLKLIPIEVANECLVKLFGDILDQLDAIEKIAKNHKHKTFGAGYSEKPSW